MNSAFLTRRLIGHQARMSTFRMQNFWKVGSRSFSAVTNNKAIMRNTLVSMQAKNYSSAAGIDASNMSGDEYITAKYSNFQDDVDLTPYSEVSAGEIDSYVQTTLIQEYGYSEEDIDYLLYFNSNVALPSEYEGGDVIPNITKYFTERLGATVEESKEILLRYPRYMNIDTQSIEDRMVHYAEVGIGGKEPTIEEMSEIFRANPFYFLCPTNNYKRIVAEFRRYKFTREQTIKFFKEQGGVLGFKKGAIQGLFDAPRHILGVKAPDLREIILKYPEFIYQARRNILVEKLKIVIKNSKAPKLYLRDLFLRHPELFLKSYGSFKAKENFFVIELGRSLKGERSWPLMLKFNYNQHIRPRCTLAYNQNFEFDLTEALIGTDEEFCEKFGFTMDQLEEERSQHKITEEKDILWRYVPIP